MNIVILGAGQVGRSLARNLANEDNDITIIDTDKIALRELREKLDVHTRYGHASHPDVLEQANVNDADMLIAVTNSDEVNMISCQIAYSLFRTPTKIARVRAAGYLEHQELFTPELIPVDVLISPEELITRHIQRLIANPGTLQVIDFAEGKVRLVSVKAYHEGPLVGHEIRQLAEHLPEVKARVAAIFRKGKSIIPSGNTVIEANDEIFVIASAQHIRAVVSELRSVDKPYKRIMIAGGGNVGRRLANILEEGRYQVKIIEKSPEVANLLAETLNKTIVLEGDAADETLLVEENITDIDIFCALTNDDEANILSAMLAKRLGARKVMALVNKTGYIDLVENANVDHAVSPQQITIGALLAHVRGGDVVSVHSLRKGAAEVLEVIAHGDKENSRVVGRKRIDLKLPPGATIGAIVRNEEVIMPHQETVIEENDHVILFLTDKRYVSAIEKMFQVGVGYI
ncbi:MAG TPA: Trk system potassium transporter TrkA [Leucothrix sp.]|nr:Trk system potassium transporter TrkA [Leucothrix sp.]